jgi:transcriptional regulator with XRE-family HTH domain
MLGWTRQRLADRAGMSLNAVIRFEQGVVASRTNTISAVRRVLEEAGIEFLSLSGQVEGVKLRIPKRRRTPGHAKRPP